MSMSAWWLGRDGGRTAARTEGVRGAAAGDTVAGGGGDGRGGLGDFIGKIVTWIPAEVVAFYGAAVAAIISDPSKRGGWVLVLIGVILSALLVVLGAWSATTGSWFTKRVKFRTAMAPIAFLIWSTTVPDSAWNSWHVVAHHRGWSVIVAALLGLLFSQVAAGIDKRFPAPAAA
jgi:hypothetical protein